MRATGVGSENPGPASELWNWAEKWECQMRGLIRPQLLFNQSSSVGEYWDSLYFIWKRFYYWKKKVSVLLAWPPLFHAPHKSHHPPLPFPAYIHHVPFQTYAAPVLCIFCTILIFQTLWVVTRQELCPDPYSHPQSAQHIQKPVNTCRFIFNEWASYLLLHPPPLHSFACVCQVAS